MKQKSKGLFVTFEGGEGAGKTSLITRLDEALQRNGHRTIVTREPGGTALGEHLRTFLLSTRHDPVVPKAELLLFLAGRIQHIETVIEPALIEGKVVLCDRFQDSTVAYQGAARGLGMEWVNDLCNLSCQHFHPDLTFLLDIDPKIGLERARATDKQEAVSGQFDRIEAEKLEFHQQVRNAFLALAKKERDRIVVIDATQSRETVYELAYNRLKENLKRKDATT